MHIEELRSVPRPEAMALPAIGMLVMLLVGVMALVPPIGGPKLPVAATGTPVPREGLTVGVDVDGRIWIAAAPDPGPVAGDELADRLRALGADRGGPAVLHLEAAVSVPYGDVQPVLRAARELGIREVHLIVACPRGRESLLRSCNTRPAINPYAPLIERR